MALPQGINFRATSGYVTDGTDEDYEIGTTLNYPRTSAQGNSVGWESGASGYGIDTRDRNSGNDRRLAGLGFETTGSSRSLTYRIDLPASGSHDFRLAMGDASAASANMKYELYDTTTLLTSQATMGTSASNEFKDATGTQYTAANWPGSNTAVNVSFSTTICRLKIIETSTDVVKVNHFQIQSAAATTTRGTPFGTRGTAFNGGRTFWGIIRRVMLGVRNQYA